MVLVGPAGKLPVPLLDPILPKLALLYEGECEGLGPIAAAPKFGYSKQRYFQLRQALEKGGTLALQDQKRGPKTNYRRTDQVLQQVVRYRFLDSDASAAVIGQKLRQTGQTISTRSVERVIAQFGLQKKLHRFRPNPLPAEIPTQRRKLRQKLQPADPESLERAVRQLLADKVNPDESGVGLWLLVPEHLRLGIWDLLCGWSGQPAQSAAPRLALQLVHEAALCVTACAKAAAWVRKALNWPMACPSLRPTRPSTTCWTLTPSSRPRSCKSPWV